MVRLESYGGPGPANAALLGLGGDRPRPSRTTQHVEAVLGDLEREAAVLGAGCFR